MIRRWLALTYYLYALRLAALSHFYFNRLYLKRCFCGWRGIVPPYLRSNGSSIRKAACICKHEVQAAFLPDYSARVI